MKLESLKKAYNNFYKNTHNLTLADYIEFNYKGYVATCIRCEVEPKSFTNWIGA